MAVETWFSKCAILDMRDVLRVNFFGADKGKNLICKFFIETDCKLNIAE